MIGLPLYKRDNVSCQNLTTSIVTCHFLILLKFSSARLPGLKPAAAGSHPGESCPQIPGIARQALTGGVPVVWGCCVPIPG